VLENCYCGTAGSDCLEAGYANGSCRAEVEAALETSDPTELLQRFGGSVEEYPLFRAANELLECEAEECAESCVAVPACGDGRVQDRSRLAIESITFRIGGLTEPCLDEYTATKLGCSFEECDDGNLEGGDGCDANCFLEACGNYVKQGTEDCDDGNSVDGDGCSSCVADYVCGDSALDDRFEECDPPSDGPVCSMQEVTENPGSCGCDMECTYKVCGNGVVQDGEDCDPPNGATCSESCRFTIDTCTECLLPLEFLGCGLILEGFAEDPQLALGCLDNPVCYDLWTCYRTSLCHYTGTYASPFACYCGGEQTPAACYQGAPPQGVCRDEMLAAFEAQWESPPVDAQQLAVFTGVRETVDFTPTTLPYFQANFLIETCIASPDALRAALVDETDLDDSAIDTCINACFP
jgi:cysteine-rich repeat protein